MFSRLFGSKKEEPVQQQAPKPKQLNEMNKDELKEVQKSFKKELNKGIRELDKLIYKNEDQKKLAELNLKKEI